MPIRVKSWKKKQDKETEANIAKQRMWKHKFLGKKKKNSIQNKNECENTNFWVKKTVSKIK